ncbi:MAG: hypothetical protein ACTSYD_02500 [Candidatus Heimdallarchaeaceae archaeon]
MKKTRVFIEKYNNVLIYLNKLSGCFEAKVGDLKFSETNLNILREKIDEAKVWVTNVKAYYFSGFASSDVEEVTIVRVDFKWKKAYDEDGKEYELSDLYEVNEKNKKIKENYAEMQTRGWAILHAAERLARTMKPISKDALKRGGLNK